MNQEQPPFTCTHSHSLPEILFDLNCTLAITTYQAGKIIFISATDKKRLIQLPRTLPKPMGVANHQGKLAIATQSEVVVFNNAKRMAPNYPQKPDTYDALFAPRMSYYTGELDIHDLHWVNDALWAVNTKFSCLATLDAHYNFRPMWKPFFITKILPEDQCHLNGVAFENDSPRYVTALGKTNTSQGWRPQKARGGILMDVQLNKIVSEGLQMPHSPRIYRGELYLLESASGELVRINTTNGKKETVISLDGFVRGMDRIGDYLFIGLSQLRKKSVAFSDLPIARKSIFCGVMVVHLPTARVIGHLKYENSVEEIYDIRILENMRRPNLLNPQKPEHRLIITTPDEDYWAVLNEKQEDDKNATDTNP